MSVITANADYYQRSEKLLSSSPKRKFSINV